MRVASYPITVWEEHAIRIQAENARTHPGLKVVGMRWLGRASEKEYAPLLVEVSTAEQANRLINKGLAIVYNLKIVKRFNLKARIT